VAGRVVRGPRPRLWSLRETQTEEQIRGWIQERVDEANRLFVNSGASRVQYELLAIRPVSPRLPDTQALPLPPSSQRRLRIQEILNDWITGELPILNHHLEAYGADLAMFVTTPYTDRAPAGGGDVCGVATLPFLAVDDDGEEKEFHLGLPTRRLFGKEAFAVVEYKCGASGNRNDYTFAHELGHTLGMFHSAAERPANVELVLPHAVGRVLRNDEPLAATVMACVVDDDYNNSQVPNGVCNRIPHFSSPHITYSVPGCTPGPCQVVTGSHDADNAGVACERAPIYAAFREPPKHPDEPPTVVIHSVQELALDGSWRDIGSEVRGGTTVRLRADAADPEEGNLTYAIQWLGPNGELLGTGPSVQLQLIQPGYVHVSARVADSRGQVDEWAFGVRVSAPNEPQRVFPRVGAWYNPARDGTGIDLLRTSDGRYVVGWYTYRFDGSPIWYISDVAPIEGTRWRSPLYVSTWNGSTNSLQTVGTLEMSFSGERSATFSWAFPALGIQGTEPFMFYTFDTGVTGVANGSWYPPAESGWGISLTHMGNVGVITASTYDEFGQPTWAQGRAEGDPSDWVFADLYQYSAPGLCPSCDASLPRTLFRNLGTARFGLLDAAAGTGTLSLHINYAASSGSWHRANVPFTRLTAGP